MYFQETFPVLDQEGWVHGHVEEALRLSDYRAAAVHGTRERLHSFEVSGLSQIDEEIQLRHPPEKKNASRPSTLSIPSNSSSSSLNVPTITHTKHDSPSNAEKLQRFLSMPSRSKSEKASPKRPNEFRPRALTNETTQTKKTESFPVSSSLGTNPGPLDISSIKFTIQSSDSIVSREDKTPSRDSIQLIASPVVRLRSSSEEDSVISDPSDSLNQQREKSYSISSDGHQASSSDKRLLKKTELEIKPETLSQASLNPLSSHKVVEDSERVSFKIGSVNLGGTGNYNAKDSSSSDSSHPSKSRGSSFYTNDSTSGVGSCESNPQGQGAPPSALGSITTSTLTPIASSSSISALALSSNLLTGAEQSKETPVHPSAISRSQFGFSRVPSNKRRPQSNIDSVGWAALKEIKKSRTYSSNENESTSLLEAPPGIKRTMSQDSELSVPENTMWLSIRRNISCTSLGDFESATSPMTPTIKLPFKHYSPKNRFVGITVPVDIKMIFEVVEGEDKRTISSEQSSQQFLASPEPPLSMYVPPLKKETTYTHTKDACLLCCEYRQTILPPSAQALEESSNEVIDSYRDHRSIISSIQRNRRRGESITDQSSATPGSASSVQSSEEIGDRRMTDTNEQGRELIQMEVMKLIVNLGSSLRLNQYEAGLLSLKQRFPNCFKNVCFYSEVCYLLSTYSYRLMARRFIQELFDELDSACLIEGPAKLLAISLTPDPDISFNKQDSIDEFQDFSFS